ncbi:MAG TPA: hypothetical protein PLN10_09545 [Candidatus Aminicenantes bacterium]|jgi:hypothetical protein|nr:hypothetical protein [Candidatus Aminicenantes bacterium]
MSTEEWNGKESLPASRSPAILSRASIRSEEKKHYGLSRFLRIKYDGPEGKSILPEKAEGDPFRRGGGSFSNRIAV